MKQELLGIHEDSMRRNGCNNDSMAAINQVKRSIEKVINDTESVHSKNKDLAEANRLLME